MGTSSFKCDRKLRDDVDVHICLHTWSSKVQTRVMSGSGRSGRYWLMSARMDLDHLRKEESLQKVEKPMSLNQTRLRPRTVGGSGNSGACPAFASPLHLHCSLSQLVLSLTFRPCQTWPGTAAWFRPAPFLFSSLVLLDRTPSWESTVFVSC